MLAAENLQNETPASIPEATNNPSRARGPASRLLEELMRHRRAAGEACPASCPACHGPHLGKIQAAVESGEPITLVLPAFPGKSPNLAKVLGVLPDLAERRSLEFLQRLCERLTELHAPGVKVVLCSDGRVFSDVVGMREEHVSAYQREIARLIRELGLRSLSTFDLDEVFGGAGYGEMRAHLMQNFGVPLECLQEKVRRGGKEGASREEAEAHRMYLGITRFLVEDSSHPGQCLSRTQVQKDCKARAYEVIRRSNAWSALIARLFPRAVRLSIHPQACGAGKLGIRLAESDGWITPWHGVAMKVGGRFVLLKRAEAEALGARVVHAGGRPSHFELPGAAL